MNQQEQMNEELDEDEEVRNCFFLISVRFELVRVVLFTLVEVRLKNGSD